MKMNLDTVPSILVQMEQEMEGTIGQPVDNVLDGGPWQFQGYDKNGLLRSLNPRLVAVHKVYSSFQSTSKNNFFFHLSREVKPTETNLANNSQWSENEHGRAVRS